jgi:hypothetical protein
MARAQDMLDTEGYPLTLRICNVYCYTTATMVARTRLNITLYVHWVPCLNLLPLILDFYSLYLKSALESLSYIYCRQCKVFAIFKLGAGNSFISKTLIIPNKSNVHCIT